MSKIKIAFLFFLVSTNSFCQDSLADSLKNVLKNAKDDTSRCKILNALVEEESDDRIWPVYNEQQRNICEQNLKNRELKDVLRIFYLKYLGEALNNIGFLSQQHGNALKAIEYFKRSLSIREEINYKNGIAESLNNLGVIYLNQGDVPEALEFYHKALRIYETIGDKAGTAMLLNNIGSIYKNQQNISKALEYFEKSLKIETEIQDKMGLAYAYNNIGNIYFIEGKIAEALGFLNKSYGMSSAINDKIGMALSLDHISKIYQNEVEKHQYKTIAEKDTLLNKALEYLTKSLQLQREIKDKKGMAFSLNSIATLQFLKGKTASAIKSAENSLILSNELGYPEIIRYASGLLSRLYAETGNFKRAYEMQVLFKQMADSISNETNKKASIQKEFQYVYERKTTADSIKALALKKVSEAKLNASEAKLKQEKTQRFTLYGGLVIVITFAGFIFNRFKISQKQKRIIELKEQETQKQNEEITHQKNLVEEKQKEILDSINYAKRIQYSLLAHHEFLNHNLPEHFVLFKPKDIVSGDFYWATKRTKIAGPAEQRPVNSEFRTTSAGLTGSAGLFYLAVCDSTGHGVPGAFMSLLNIGFLSEAINEKDIEKPDEVFNYVRRKLIESISKEGQKDGFDGILICFDSESNQITYSAANNSPLIVKNGCTEELKCNRMPVGIGERKEDFDLHTLKMERGDILYLYTDGFADQFGGPKGKKFKYKQLNELLLSNSSLSMPEQKAVLFQKFNDWKGNLEQVDDVCLIGIRF